MRIKTQQRIRSWLAYGLGSIFVLALVMPLIWVVTTSVRPLAEMMHTPPLIFPRSITFDAYVELWDTAPFVKYFINSVVISLSTALIALVFSICAAYAFARFRFKGSTFLLMVVVMSQMLPGSSIRAMGLLDTHAGMVLIYTGFAIPFCTWLLNGYFRAIPVDLEQAALIDGCNRLELLYRIILPLAAPAIVAVGTFAFLLSWNEFLFAFVFTKSQALTIPVGLRAAFLGQYVNKYDQLFAASLIFSIPPIAIFVGLQRHFVQGLTAGAVKE
jgi:ABC-type glycerol-3-phosphate transport system permease component